MQQNLFSVLYFILLFSIARSALLKQHRLVMSSKAAAPQEENYQQVAMGMPNFEFAAPEANYTNKQLISQDMTTKAKWSMIKISTLKDSMLSMFKHKWMS